MKKALSILAAVAIALSLLAGCNISPKYITIAGKEYSTSTDILCLHGNNLSDEDIVPLKHMTNLTRLELSATKSPTGRRWNMWRMCIADSLEQLYS